MNQFVPLTHDEVKLARWLTRTLEPWAIDTGVIRGSIEWNAALVLLAAIRLATTSPDQIARVCHLSPRFAQQVGTRCRKARIWHGSRIRARWMESDHPGDGDFSFMLDVMVAAGRIDRSIDPALTLRGQLKRAKRRINSQCVTCGHAASDGLATCAKCRASVIASRHRRADRLAELTAAIKPFYRLNDRQRSDVKTALQE